MTTGSIVQQVSTTEKLRAIEREIAFRRIVYPRRVAENKMTQRQASYQLSVMEAIMEDYRAAAERERLL